jgi:4a-hydroxytetrahydrobiopterin dehydratase
MSTNTVEELRSKKCQPCEGGVPPVSREKAEHMLTDLPHWSLTDDGRRIRRECKVADFLAAIDFFIRISQVAEEEGHHPDLHLVEYRNVTVELWTHAIGGLSENDFIVAAKIDELPVEM